MNILVIGSGGREHAICWKLRQSTNVETIYCAPGNPGIGMVARCIDIKVDDIQGLKRFAQENKIDLTVVGPEYPLTLGIVDEFRASGLRIFGPSKEASQLEGSKSFAKQVMNEAEVPTARYKVVFEKKDALEYLQKYAAPVVFKADGLASGKGVFVCHTDQDARDALEILFAHGTQKVVIEEFLAGIEVSYIVATDGEHIVPMAPSHDYKRIFDKDQGPNTGGMGSVCPTPRFTEEDEEKVIYSVIVPTIQRMKARGTPFTGFLYAGLMKSPDGTFNVIEFNTRLGDPETQSIMRRMKSDFAEMLYFLSEPADDKKRIMENLPPVEWDDQACVCIVVAADGYPGTPATGDEITGLPLAETMPDVIVFHAGTAADNGKIVSAGGRVLGVTAVGNSVSEARQKAYKGADIVQFRGCQKRRDIGLE